MASKPNPAIDIKLSRLVARTPKGQTVTRDVLADSLGCSRQYVAKVERTALKKLRELADSLNMIDFLRDTAHLNVFYLPFPEQKVSSNKQTTVNLVP